MPRQQRLDIPGLLHHVMARGMERAEILRDDRDLEVFVERLGELMPAGGATLHAWRLLSNHFHLVRKPGKRGLAWLMRRLMTSHAGRFNLRHGRSGHLFQNRYKSVMNLIFDEIAEKWGTDPPRVLGGLRGRRICRAWREFFLRSMGEAGLSIADLGRLCAMNPASVSRAVETARAELRSAKPPGERARRT